MWNKKDGIISKFKSHYWRTSHKSDIALSHSVEKNYAIDEYNGNNFWWVAIDKELNKIQGMETFEIMEGVKP